jgi:hypothetical protein
MDSDLFVLQRLAFRFQKSYSFVIGVFVAVVVFILFNTRLSRIALLATAVLCGVIGAGLMWLVIRLSISRKGR